MILVLLLAAALVIGGIGFGVYLLVRPDPPPSATPPERPGRPDVTGSTVTPPPSAATTTTGSVPRPSRPDPGAGTGTNPTDRPGGSTEAGLRAVARDYVDAVNARDGTAATGLTCDRTGPGTLFSVAGDRAVSLGAVEVLAGTVASATVRVGDGDTALLMEKQEDGWCVAI